MNWVIERLKEPSSWVSIGTAIAGVTGIVIAPELWAQIAGAGVAFASLLGFVLAEKA